MEYMKWFRAVKFVLINFNAYLYRKTDFYMTVKGNRDDIGIVEFFNAVLFHKRINKRL